MNEPANAKVFIIKTKYGYSVSPSPVVIPKGGATLDFENLSPDVAGRVSIPGTEPFTLKPNQTQTVTLPRDRVIFYRVEMENGLIARGNSAPIIIRDA